MFIFNKFNASRKTSEDEKSYFGVESESVAESYRYRLKRLQSAI